MATLENKQDLLPDISKNIDYLANHDLLVGIFGKDESGSDDEITYVRIANMHEFGKVIYPKKKNDYLYLPVKNAQTGDIISFRKVKSVTIPERSFLRTTVNEKEKEWNEKGQIYLGRLLDGSLTGQDVLVRMGRDIVRDIQQTIEDMKSPKNADLTIYNKDVDNPLIESGTMKNRITFVIVERGAEP